jgi:DNA-binding winged helix-turn-helix (wHTH) protein
LLLTLIEAAPNAVSHDQLVAAICDGRPVSPETIRLVVQPWFEA